MNVRQLRALLLLVLALVVGSVVWSLARRPAPVAQPAPPSTDIDRDVVIKQENPEHRISSGSDIAQVTKGSEVTTDKYGRQHWKGFDSTRELDDGRSVTVKADEALFDPRTMDFEVLGNVEVTTSDGYRLAGARLTRTTDETKGTEVYESVDPVEFARPDISGEARQLRADLENDYVVMKGYVKFVVDQGERPPLKVDGPVVMHDDNARRTHFPRGATLVQGQSKMRCDNLEIHHRPKGEKGVERIEARGRVVVDHVGGGGTPGGAAGAFAGANRLEADLVIAHYQAAGRGIERVVAEGSIGPATLELRPEAPDSGTRALSAHRIELVYEDGAARRTFSQGAVKLRIDGTPARTIASEWSEAELADGDVSAAEFGGNVIITEPGRTASSDRAEYLAGDDVIILSSDSARKARIVEGDSQLLAQRIESRQAEQLVLADGDVELTWVDGGQGDGGDGEGGLEGLLSRSTAPVRALAGRMRSNQATSTIVFTEDARLWKGETIIEAPRITVEQEGRVLLAEEGARALWQAADGEDDEPVRIESTVIRLDDTRHRLTCDGTESELVKLRQGETLVTGINGVFDLDPDTSRVKNGTMSGDVGIVAEDRSGTGDEVKFDMTYGRKVVLKGSDVEPARMVSALRGETRGEELIFYLDEDIVSVAGGRTNTTIRLGEDEGEVGTTSSSR